MFGSKGKISISAYHTFEFVELLVVRLIRGDDLSTALSSMKKLRISSRIFELLDHDADLLSSQLDKNSGHFILLCAVLQTMKNKDSNKIIDALALIKVRMVDLLYSQGSADFVVFHGKSPKQYARELLQLLTDNE